MQLSIIIPVQDEADSIEPLLEELRVAMGELPGWEVLVVDDGSSDDTAARVRACAAAGYPGLRLLCHARGCGTFEPGLEIDELFEIPAGAGGFRVGVMGLCGTRARWRSEAVSPVRLRTGNRG